MTDKDEKSATGDCSAEGCDLPAEFEKDGKKFCFDHMAELLPGDRRRR